jgi:hypothetical protein
MQILFLKRLGGAIALLALVGGCSAKASTDNDISASGSDAVSGKDDADGAISGDTGDQADIGGPVQVTESFWITYERHQRVVDPGTTAYSDIVLTAWQNAKLADPGNISTFGMGLSPLDSKKPAFEFTKSSFNTAGLGCDFGCLISRDLGFVAIATGPASADGFEYQLGVMNSKLQVTLGKFGKIQGVIDIHFAGGDLFYSQRVGCQSGNTVCQYAIHKRFMANVSPTGDSDIVLIPKMAPDEDTDIIKDTTYGGHFQVSDDGKTIVILTPTIRSVKVYAWRDGNLSKLDYICEHPNGSECSGTGSQYHDTDKVAIGPDGKTIVLFTIVDRFLRARKYVIGTEVAPTFSNLVEVPAGNYLQQACSVIKKNNWQHVEVIGTPFFSADGQFVYHLGYSHCSDAPTDKDFTDIMALPVAKIGDTIGEGDWLNLTKNPRDNTTKNRKIFSFNMSPQRQVFLISATATQDQAGDPIKDGTSRELKDSELYTLTVGDTEWHALTNELTYDALLPEAVLPVTP